MGVVVCSTCSSVSHELEAMIRRRAKRERGDCTFIDKKKGSLATHADAGPASRAEDREEEERLEALVFGGQPFASQSDEESEACVEEEASAQLGKPPGEKATA